MFLPYSFIFPIVLMQMTSAIEESNIEVLPDGCDCRDWYGGCRKKGDSWIDDETWMYSCSDNQGLDASFEGCQGRDGKRIPSSANETIDGFWHSCQVDNVRLRYEQESRCVVDDVTRHVGEEFRIGSFQWLCLDTGRWVTGCYYKNETEHDVLLKIGETGYNGLIKHVCDRFIDFPGRVQYYAQVREDVPVKHPTNKGVNRNFPPAKEDLIKGKVTRWLHENVDSFVANGDAYRARIRYLPASRREWTE